ncbi:MAG: PD-(D/E)XK nuclease family protein [Steroidobacteraceae bacterium]|nr:PD-(D/E)XK nuclease family protein [Steroidobacteraceae bacterium]
MDLNERCLAHLEAGGLVLTADLRQARILRRLHDRAQVDRGLRVWPSAQVLPLDAWLAQQWREAASERDGLPQALPPVALRWLWRRLTALDAPGLLDPAELGTRARASWLRLRSHGGDVAGLSGWPLTRDQQAFAGWARAAERELADHNACDPADLAQLLVAHRALPLPGPPLLLVGFRRPTPAQLALSHALAGQGWQVDRPGEHAAAGKAWRHAAADSESERDAMLAWLRARLDERPDGIHGLVIPDLTARRGAVERALAAALQPSLELPGAGRDRVFDLAGGQPLASQPVVETAFDAIHCALGLADWTIVTRLLRSAGVTGGLAEQEPRMRLDVALRDAGAYPAAPAALAAAAKRMAAPGFAGALSLAVARLAGPARRSAADWAESFGACLAGWGWPGEAALDSSAWQSANRLRELLHELAALSPFAPGFTAAEALAQLRDLAAAPFQAESGEPSVFVMDAWEDPGLGFDSLWVSGLTASAWPRPVAVDPLLPIEVQRRLGMPQATAQDCVADARAIVACWRTRAAALVMSWPRRENDTDVDGSLLVPADLPALPPSADVLTREKLWCAAGALEPLGEDPAPALGTTRARGGARVLELQSQCPFRAFARLRLGAEPLEEPQPGIDRRVRGQLLHRALEWIWSELGGQQALLALGPDARERMVEEGVDRAIAGAVPAGTGARTLGLEREWQLRAISRLLALECGRGPFTVVETERAMTGRIGGLELALRVDRVDDAGGALLVIDYKTGAVRGAPWRGARMDAPQLPLYAVLHPRRPAGVAIAEVGALRARFVGVGTAAAGIEGLVPAEEFRLTEERESGFGWPQVTARWYAWLERLARDYAGGRAEVDPKLAGNTCRQCHLGALCRVEPAVAEGGDDGETGDDA